MYFYNISFYAQRIISVMIFVLMLILFIIINIF